MSNYGLPDMNEVAAQHDFDNFDSEYIVDNGPTEDSSDLIKGMRHHFFFNDYKGPNFIKQDILDSLIEQVDMFIGGRYKGYERKITSYYWDSENYVRISVFIPFKEKED